MSIDAAIFFAGAALFVAALGELLWRRASGNRLPREYVAAKRRAMREPSYLALAPTGVITLVGAETRLWALAGAGGSASWSH